MDEPWILDLDASGIINIFHLTALWLKPWILDLIAFAAVRSFIHPTDPTAEAGQALQRGRSEPLDRCAVVPLYLFIHLPDLLERGRVTAVRLHDCMTARLHDLFYSFTSLNDFRSLLLEIVRIYSPFGYLLKLKFVWYRQFNELSIRLPERLIILTSYLSELLVATFTSSATTVGQTDISVVAATSLFLRYTYTESLVRVPQVPLTTVL